MKEDIKNELQELCALFQRKGELWIKAYSSQSTVIHDKYLDISKEADQKLKQLKEKIDEQ